MTEQKKTNYTFESQLELGEMLLSLGRIAEAEVELKKARDLNEVGAFTTPEDSPERQVDLQRLATALARVEEMQGSTERRNRRLGVLAALVLVLATIGVFALWALNRATLIETRSLATQEAEIAALQATENAADVQFAQRENTRTAEQISDLYQEIGRIAAEGTRVAAIVGVAPEMATAAAQNADSNATLVAMVAMIAAEGTIAVQEATQRALTAPTPAPVGTGGGAATSTPAPAQTVTPINAAELGDLLDKLRITTFAANMRGGPGFNYYITGRLDEGQIVTVLAQSEDRYWYSIVTDAGTSGWVHASLAKPLTLDWLPVETNVPLPPFVPGQPETTTTPTSAATRRPTSTPRPTATVLPTPEATATQTPTPIVTVTPTATLPATLTLTTTPTVEVTPTATLTATVPLTPTVTLTPTATLTPTVTPSETVPATTPTATATPNEASTGPTLTLVRPTLSP